MPNSYFRFKQFTIEQDKCAMKVCTDSCLFGAWAANWLQHQTSISTVMDIGAGTGLLSLMLAQQKKNIKIEAIEIDTAAAQQAKENFARSVWSDNLLIIEGDVKSICTGKCYDFIISNPPFYQDDLLSSSDSKNKAHHHTSLSLNALLAAVKRLLCSNGYFAILLPYHRAAAFEEKAGEEGFVINERIIVRPSENAAPFRVMMMLSYHYRKYKTSDIAIKSAAGNYTEAFITLLRDYYLYL